MTAEYDGPVGEIPSAFFTSLAAADEQVAELERLRARVAELEALHTEYRHLFTDIIKWLTQISDLAQRLIGEVNYAAENPQAPR